MTTKIKLHGRALNDLYVGMHAAIACCEDELLESDLDKNPDLDVIFVTEEGKEYTPISLAVSFENENAVRILCARMKAQGILNHHLSREILDYSPLHVASFRGHPNITKILLSYGADPNAFAGISKDANGETPLMGAVEHISSHSLIECGDWDKETQNQLRLWYAGIVLKGQENEPAFPSTATAVTWHGNNEIIEELLSKKGVDPTAKDKFGISPYKLLTTLTDPKHIERNTFHDGVSHPKVLSVSDDVIVFEAQIMNRLGERHPIKVTYDVREIRAMLAQKIEDNKKDALAIATAVATSPKKESKEDKEQAERKQNIDAYSKTPALNMFFTDFAKDLNTEISTALTLLTNKVDRAHYTKADHVADGIGMASDLPLVGAFVGGAPKAIGKGIILVNNKLEKDKFKNLKKNVAVPPSLIPTFCEDIALGILEQYSLSISKLDLKKVETFVKEAVEKACAILVGDKISDNPKVVIRTVINLIVKNIDFSNQLSSLVNKQLKENAKEAAASAKQATDGTMLTHYSSSTAQKSSANANVTNVNTNASGELFASFKRIQPKSPNIQVAVPC